MKFLSVFIPILFFSSTLFSQAKYTLNNFSIMNKMGLCYFGDSVIYNNLDNEFRVPLPKCSDVTFHSFELKPNLYVIYPLHHEYCGSGGCHIYLMKNVNGKFQEIDEVWGNLDVNKSRNEQNTFFYMKTNKSSMPYKDIKNRIVVDTIDEKFKIN